MKSLKQAQAARSKRHEVAYTAADLKQVYKKLGQVAVSEEKGRESLEARLAEIAQLEEQNDIAQREDPDIIRLKDKLKEANSSYNETRKDLKLRKRAVVMLLQGEPL